MSSYKHMFRTRSLLISLYLLSAAGCGLKTVPPTKVALDGYSTWCEGQVLIRMSENSPPRTHVVTLPGEQHFEVLARGRPSLQSLPEARGFSVCAPYARYEVSFPAEGGKRHRFYLDESTRDSPALTVWREVEPGDPKVEEVPARVSLIETKQVCTAGVEYDDCPTVSAGW